MVIDALVSLAFVVAGYVIGWCVRDYVQQRREARAALAKASWGYMAGSAVDAYVTATDDGGVTWRNVPVESLGRAE